MTGWVTALPLRLGGGTGACWADCGLRECVFGSDVRDPHEANLHAAFLFLLAGFYLASRGPTVCAALALGERRYTLELVETG